MFSSIRLNVAVNSDFSYTCYDFIPLYVLVLLFTMPGAGEPESDMDEECQKQIWDYKKVHLEINVFHMNVVKSFIN